MTIENMLFLMFISSNNNMKQAPPEKLMKPQFPLH